MNKNFNLIMFRLLGFVIALVFTLAACNQVASPVEATIGVTALDDQPSIIGFELDKRVVLVGQIVTANGAYEPASATSAVLWGDGSTVNDLDSPFKIFHEYTVAGEYEVELTVRAENDIASAKVDIDVYATGEDLFASLIDDVNELEEDIAKLPGLPFSIQKVSKKRLGLVEKHLVRSRDSFVQGNPKKSRRHLIASSKKDGCSC